MPKQWRLRPARRLGANVTRVRSAHGHQEEKHPFAPLFRLSSSLDRRLLSGFRGHWERLSG